MTVVSVVKDTAERRLTLTARFAAPVERVWQVWADPRQLEGWWGPPGYPATVLEHDLVPGGATRYFMTGPDGTRHGGHFAVLAVQAPRELTLDARLADPEGVPLPDSPTGTIRVVFTPLGDGGTEMVITTTWPDADAMQRALATGMETGMAQAAGQIDALLDADERTA